MPIYITHFKRNQTTTLAQLDQIMQRINASAPQNIRGRVHTFTVDTAAVRQTPEIIEKLKSLENLLIKLNEKYPENEKKLHYDVFEIPKASGGTRTIKAPNDELKHNFSCMANYLSEWLNLLAHDNAYAYVPHRMVKHAIEQHQKNESQWFLKLDIAKFFDNCSTQLIETQLNKIYPLCLNPNLCREIAKFATWENELPQGTPLSPLLTNLIMIPFDHHISRQLESFGYIYTRYADDMLISSKESFKFTNIIEMIETCFKENDYHFQIKKEKTRYGSRNGRNWNLGLMLNKDNQITLGHDFKKKVKTILFKTETQNENRNDPHIIGLFSYLQQIEPKYYNYLNHYALSHYQKTIKQIINP